MALYEETDVEIDIRPIEALPPGVPDCLEPRYENLRDYVDEDFAPDVVVWHTRPDNLKDMDLGDTPAVAITTWEASPFPPQHAHALKPFDLVIVPSTFCVDVLTRAGLENVVNVPHTYDPFFWAPSELPRDPDRPYRYYTIGAWGERKNPLGVLKAYLTAFTKRDPVHLTMVLQNADMGQIKSVIGGCGIPVDELPALNVPPNRLSEEELLDLHQGADCFVSATRGEGWGLGAFEAACVGNRIIMPAETGQRDFLEVLGYPVVWSPDCRYAPVFPEPSHLREVEVNGQKMIAGKAALAPGMTCKQRWLDPSLSSMAVKMRSVLHNHKEFPPVDLEEFEKRFSYETVGPQLADTLERITK
jgi:glycosyltransferase involved in cell wall biosynthesis